jgi:hypothetical protein
MIPESIINPDEAEGFTRLGVILKGVHFNFREKNWRIEDYM